MVIMLLVSLASGLFYYIQGFKAGLIAKRWGWAGLFFGPLLLPIFAVHCQLAMRRAAGFNNVYLAA